MNLSVYFVSSYPWMLIYMTLEQFSKRNATTKIGHVPYWLIKCSFDDELYNWTNMKYVPMLYKNIISLILMLFSRKIVGFIVDYNNGQLL